MRAQQVGIVDYGIGNLKSVAAAVAHLGATPVVSADPAALLACDRLILPGVGAFPSGMAALGAGGLQDVVAGFTALDRPCLGICLGMQLLLEASTEFGGASGLGLIAGQVTRLSEAAPENAQLRLPNVGWLPLEPVGPDPYLRDMTPGARFYFIHSYAAQPGLAATAAHSTFDGIRFTSMVRKGYLVGTQFHPEKSGAAGLCLLRAFLS